LLTQGPTRSGKGVSAIIPNLLTYEGSALVIDPKGENAMITAEHRRNHLGQIVHVIDPWGITGLRPSKINPMDWLVAAGLDLTENAMMLADAMTVMSDKADPFWGDTAKSGISGLLQHVATDPAEDGQRHLGRVRDLMLLDGEELEALFRRMLESPHHLVRSTGARFLNMDPKLLSNVMASMQAQTHFLDSPRVREALSQSDFSFADLKRDKVTIYLVVPADRLETFGRFLRLLVQQALTENARDITDVPDKPILFILDELAALGRLTMVEQAYGLMAGYGVQLWGFVQDLSQLKRIYGDGWETFISNAGVLQYFGSRDKMSADYFSALCGETTVWNFSTAVARAFGQSSSIGGLSSSESETTTETSSAVQRKLAYPDQLMRMHATRQLLLIDDLNPVAATKLPWFENPKLKRLGVNLHKPEA
jgi:type IV secretion system protein VirD4